MVKITASVENIIPQLEHVKLFAGLKKEDLNPLLQVATIKEINKTKLLLTQDGRATHLCVILSGQARIFRICKDGREVVTRILSAGDTMFENVIFYDGPSPINGEVIKKAKLLMIPASIVRQHAKNNVAFSCNVAKVLAERTNQMMYQIEQVTLHSAVERLGSYLLSAKLEQKLQNGGFEIEFEKSLLAKYLGMTPETLSRSLKELQRRGIRAKGNFFELDSDDSLCQFHDSMVAQKCPKNNTSECMYNRKKSCQLNAIQGR